MTWLLAAKGEGRGRFRYEGADVGPPPRSPPALWRLRCDLRGTSPRSPSPLWLGRLVLAHARLPPAAAAAAILRTAAYARRGGGVHGWGRSGGAECAGGAAASFFSAPARLLPLPLVHLV